jgi:hypothetical protein
MLNIFHRKRTHKEVREGGGMFRLLWERRKLPATDSPQNYAFETYGTPVYDFALGNGATFIRRPLVETQPAMWAQFTVPIVSNPPQNIFQGQFATQPLMNPNDAQALGITIDGSVPPDAYNLLAPQGPALAP